MIKYFHLLYALASEVFSLPFIALGWLAAEAYMGIRVGFRACMMYNEGTLLQNIRKILEK
jgi:hypothetical protein